MLQKKGVQNPFSILEVSFLFAVFHGGFGAFVVGAGAALGLAGGGDLGDDVIEGGGIGPDCSGAGGIADGAEADDFFGDCFAVLWFEEISDGEQGSVALKDFALVGEVDGGKGDLFAFNIHPDVHFGEIGQGEYAEVFAGISASVEKVPEFGALVFRVPLPKIVAVGEEAFLGTGFLLVAATTAECGIILMFLKGIEKGDGLEFVARGVGSGFLGHAAGVDGFLNGADDELGAEQAYELIAVMHGLIEIVSGIDVDERKRRACWPECFFREPSHDDGVLAAGEEQGGVLELRGGFPQDEDGLGFELVEVGKVVVRHCGVKLKG